MARTSDKQPERHLSNGPLGARASRISALLAEEYPGSAGELCALHHEGPFQLLCATILSAQCTDERVNMVTPALFAAYGGAGELAAADPAEVETLIKSTGFYRSKATHLVAMSRALAELGDASPSAFPTTMAELTSLPGVGRKTANVVRSVALGLPGLPVDTHVLRVSKLLGLTRHTDPVKVEADLCALVPEHGWGTLSLRLIQHGRQVCVARRPRCDACILAELCPSAQLGEHLPASRGPATTRSRSRPSKRAGAGP
ncbi:MAG: endonuclease III [Actinomycetota bacterium]|nr:endonuclease III [Actinomycetota bacterium]